MALSKNKSLPSGVTGSYWKVTRIAFDKETMKLVAGLALFLSQEVAGTEGSSPLCPLKVFNFQVTSEELSGDILALAYTKIKAKNDPDLSGAEDV